MIILAFTQQSTQQIVPESSIMSTCHPKSEFVELKEHGHEVEV